MAQLFPAWANKAPRYVLLGLTFGLVLAIAFVWYYWSPWYTDVGYAPVQPVPYSHKLHVGQLGLDCRYCHTGVEKAAVAMVPPTQTCMNCHQIVLPTSPKLALVKQSWETRTPIEWIRVHKVPDYAYFDHSMHLRAGVGCESCHGLVSGMDVVELTQPLSMGWCLECHRDPDMHLRPASAITAMGWTPPANQRELAAKIKKDLGLRPPVSCSGCHR
ncbi:MAG: cytochrome c3 family protein [Ignavibacteriae bacterium]|nr:cytochrome c3 family protein [Ignavibacteriota bacterium]